MKVMFPTGDFISPGFHEIHTIHEEEEEVWWMGHLIETKINKVELQHGVNIPDPGVEGEGEAEWPLRGTFTFKDKTWIVVRDDDPTFWGFRKGGISRTKQEWFKDLQTFNKAMLVVGRDSGWWDLDEDGTTPLRPAIKVSIAEMQAQNKALMAHLMVDLGFFPSVGQARKNGWDKPLELGRHELGPKKKRAFVEIIP